MNENQLVDIMKSRGLIPADASAPDVPADKPWFISLLMGIAGWIAGIFVLMFAAIFLDLDKFAAFRGFLVVGSILLAIAWVLYFIGRDRVFVDQLALSFSIGGQLAITVFFFEKFRDPLPITASLLGLQLLVFVVMRDRVARTLGALFTAVSWMFFVRFWLRPYEGNDLFFDGHSNTTIPPLGSWTLPGAWLLTWVPLIAGLLWLCHSETRWMSRAAADFARPAIAGLLLGLTFGGVGTEPLALLILGTEPIGRGFDWYAVFPLLSIGLALFAAWMAFRQRSAGLSGVAILAALVHLGRFYYLYGTTLTMKSVIMLVAGIVTLGIGVWLSRRAEPA